MNKSNFLKELRYKLKKLKREERNKYIEYYDEIISDIVESGVSEEAAIERQGSIEQIANDILANTNPTNIKSRDWRGIALTIASCLLLLSCIFSALSQIEFAVTSSSIGIIGGADGPTAIFVAGKIGAPWGLYIATAVVVIAAIVYFVKKRKEKN